MFAVKPIIFHYPFSIIHSSDPPNIANRNAEQLTHKGRIAPRYHLIQPGDAGPSLRCMGRAPAD